MNHILRPIFSLLLLTTGLFASPMVQAQCTEQHSEQTLYICPGDTLTIDNKAYCEAVSFVRRLQTIEGCDSLITTHIVKYPNYLFSDTITLSDADFPYSWREHNITAEGKYRSILQTINKCDSIYELVVRYAPKYLFTTTAKICSSDLPYLWRGQHYSAAGTYEQHFTTQLGQDSIYQLLLTELPTVHSSQNLSFTKGETYLIRGKEYTQSCVVYDTLVAMSGCDSIVTYRLTFYPTYHQVDTLVLRASEPFIWKGQTITQDGTYYYQSPQSIQGRDSSFQLTVYFAADTTIIDTIRICPSDLPYSWRGYIYTQSGIHGEPYQSLNSKDTTYLLNLVVPSMSQHIVEHSLCPNGQVVIEGITYTQPQDITLHYTASNGCDSTVIHRIQTARSYLFSDTIALSDKDQYNWRNRNIDHTDIYQDFFQTTEGCDSSYQLVATIYPTYLYPEQATTCQSNLPFLWRGHSYTESGTYYDKHVTTAGFDSIYQLQLTVRPSYQFDRYLELCEGDSIEYGGHIYRNKGTWQAEFSSATGCDSVENIHVVEHPSYSFNEEIEMVRGASYKWVNKRSYSEEGTYHMHYQTIHGCDSAYHLTIHLVDSYHFIEDVTLCMPSDSIYLWHGQKITESGTYYDSLYTREMGADSIYQLNFHAYHSSHTYRQINLCQGEKVTFGDTTFYNEAIWTDTLQSYMGCDSIITYYINQVPKYLFSDTAVFSNQEEHIWRGQPITKSGTYYDYLNTVDGCDSIYQLIATVHPTYIFVTDTAYCQTLGVFNWRDNDYFQIGSYTYEEKFKTIAGYDSIYRLNLTIYPAYDIDIQLQICEGGSIHYNGKDYSTPGEYLDTLHSEHGCDSICHIHVNNFKQLETRLDTICDGDTLTWEMGDLTEEGYYTRVYTSSEGCDSAFNLTLTMLYVFNRDFSDTICEAKLKRGEPYLFGPNKRPMWGSYNDSTDHYQDSIYWNCDRSHFFHLRVLPERIHEDTITFCEGDSAWVMTHTGDYRWLKQQGDYFDTIPQPEHIETYACDSVVHWHVEWLPSYHHVFTKHICDQDTFRWEDYVVTQSGTYSKHYESVFGCDSLVEWQVIVHPTYFIRDSIHICQPHYNDPYIWEGHTNLAYKDQRYRIYGPGLYTDTLRTEFYHFDSIHHLVVTVDPIYFSRSDTVICRGDYVRLGNKVITESGIYQDTVPSILGCDSIHELRVYVQNPFFYSDTLLTTSASPVTWQDTVLTHPGTYQKAYQTIYGCDSIYQLVLQMKPAYIRRDTIVHICDCDLPFVFRNHHYNQSCNFYDTVSILGTDYIYHVNLQVLPRSYDTLHLYLCQDESYTIGLTRYDISTPSGEYLHRLTAENGCDSLLTVYLHHVLTHRISQQATTSDQQPYIWQGHGNQSFRHTGIYYDTIRSTMTDCDSIIYELHLQVYPTYRKDTSLVVCRNDLPVIFGNRALEEAGQYTIPLQTIHQMDSIWTVDLQVIESQLISVQRTLCEGDAYTFNGKTYTQTGLYYDTLFNYSSCGTIYKMDLLFHHPEIYLQAAQQSGEEPYIWQPRAGKSYTLLYPGLYSDTIRTADGLCDSIIYQLQLQIYPTYRKDTSLVVCSNDLPVIFGNRALEAAGQYTIPLKTIHQMDSIWTVNLQVIESQLIPVQRTLCEGDAYTFNGKTYTQTGLYYDTIYTYGSCGTIYEMNLHFRHPETYLQTAQLATNKPYIWQPRAGKSYTLLYPGLYGDTIRTKDGLCDSIIYQLQLQVYPSYHQDTSMVVCRDDLPLIFGNKALDSTGTYTISLQTVHHMDSIWTVHLTVLETQIYNIERWFCEGDAYTFNGKTYTTDGLYIDTLHSLTSCGIIYRMNLHFRHPEIYRQTAKTSSKSPYLWQPYVGKQYQLAHSGLYGDTIRTADNQCDSVIYLMQLQVCPVYEFHDSTTLCQSELPYLWHGKTITQTGVYWDSLQTVQGYDSIYRFSVKAIYPSYYAERTLSFCENQTYVQYRSQRFYRDTTFYDQMITISGCDSVERITIRTQRSFDYTDTVHIASQDSYLFDGRQLNQSGTYHAHYTSVLTGCDSVRHLVLYVHPSYSFEDSITLCQNELPYMWVGHGLDTMHLSDHSIVYGKRISQAGIYYDSLVTKFSFDSIYQLRVTVNPSYHESRQMRICPGETLSISGVKISAPGAYDVQLLSIQGCDSIISYYVNPADHFYREYSDSVCEQDMPYVVTFNNQVRELATAGDYYLGNCDSALYIHLRVIQSPVTQERLLIAGSEMRDPNKPYIYQGISYTEPGTYRYTYASSHSTSSSHSARQQCDSVHILQLDTTNHVSPWTFIPLCTNDTVIIHDQVITETGKYTFICPLGYPPFSLDSLYQVVVYNAPTFEYYEHFTVCENELPFVRHGKSFYSSGNYPIILKSAQGCDSIYHLKLEVYPAFYHDTTIYADNNYYLWHGRKLSQTGSYYDTLSTIHGCDSAFHLYLRMPDTTRVTICGTQQTYLWKGEDRRAPGTYMYKNGTNAVEILILDVIPAIVFQRMTAPSMCANDKQFVLDLDYQQGVPDSYSVLFSAAAKKHGFRDLIHQPIDLTDIHHIYIDMPGATNNDSLNYVRPDNYDLTVVLHNGLCQDVELSTSFMVRYPNWIIRQNWNDVVAPLKKEYNGGYEFTQYDWYVNGVRQNTEGEPYLHNDRLVPGDEVVLSVVRAGESYSISTCPLVIRAAEHDVYRQPVLAYPLQVSRREPVINVESQQSGEVSIYSSTGILLQQTSIHEGVQQLQLPSTSGCYILRATTQTGIIYTTKVLLY